MSTHVWVAISHQPDDFTLTVHTTRESALQALVDAIPQADWDQFTHATRLAGRDTLERTGPVNDVLTAWYGEPDNTDADQVQFGSGSDSYAEVIRRPVIGDAQ